MGGVSDWLNEQFSKTWVQYLSVVLIAMAGLHVLHRITQAVEG